MGADTEMLTKMFQSAGATTGGGFTDKLKGLLTNRAFYSMLGGLGQDMQAGTPGVNLGKSINDSMSSKSMIDLLGRMLGGQHPGVSAKLDNKGLNLMIQREGPVSDLTTPNPGQTGIPMMQSDTMATSLGGGDVSQSTMGKDPITGQNTPMSNDFQLGAAFNPFAGGQSFSPSDLAGLNANQILAAMELKGRQDSEETNRFNSNVDAEYKLSIMKDYYKGIITGQEAQRRLDAYQNETQRGKVFVEAQNADTARYNALKGTDLEQNYAAAKEGGFTGTIEQFKAYDESGDWGNYQQALKQGSYKGTFPQWLDKYGNKGTTINLSPYERTKQTNLADREDDVLKPDYVQGVIEDMNKNKELEADFDEGEASLKASGLVPPEKKSGKAAATAWEAKVDERNELLKRGKVRARLDARIRQAYAGRNITRKKGIGWYLDGKLIVKDPYAGR
jgi:hypothetical protein